MSKFVYKGAVYAFDSLVTHCWEATTWAVSPAKARSNLKFQFRNKYNYSRCIPIDLPGQLVVAQ